MKFYCTLHIQVSPILVILKLLCWRCFFLVLLSPAQYKRESFPVCRNTEMYVDEHGAATFTPQINSASRQLHRMPIAQRSQQVVEEQRLKRVCLLEQAEEQFQIETTFQPTIDRVSEKLIAGRVPLKDRSNEPRELKERIDPEATHHPRINKASKKMLSTEARQAQHHTMEVKRKVKELWVKHTQQGGHMIKSELHNVLSELGIEPNGPHGQKFCLALGLHNGPNSCLYIEFPRFSSVLTAVLQTATATGSGPSTSSQPRQEESMGRPSTSSTMASDDGLSAPAPPKRLQQQQQQMQSVNEPTVTPTTTVHQQQPRNYYARGVQPHPQPHLQARVPREEQEGLVEVLHGDDDLFVHEETSPRSAPPPAAATIPARGGYATPRQVTTRPNTRLSAKSPSSSAQHHPPQQQKDVARALHTTTSRYRDPKAAPKVPSTEELEYKSCTFQPTTNSGSAATPSCRSSSQGEDNKPKERQRTSEERALDHCTFAPQVSKTKEPPQHPAAFRNGEPANNTPGFEQVVKRMAAAREQALPKFEESLRGSSQGRPEAAMAAGTNPAACNSAVTMAEPKPKSVLSTHRNSHGETMVQPFQLRSEKRVEQRDKPLLFVDVDIGHGRSGRIGVHRGGRPETLARNFARTYSIDTTAERKLAALLRQKIQDTLEAEKVRTLWV